MGLIFVQNKGYAPFQGVIIETFNQFVYNHCFAQTCLGNVSQFKWEM